MPITLEDIQVGRSDKVEQAVIDQLRRESPFMDALTFDDSVSPGVGGSTMTYGYIQLKTPSMAAFRDINTEYTADSAKKEKKTANLKIFGGSSQIDRVLEETSANSEVSFQLEQKTKAVRNLFHNSVINGAKSGNAVEFDGLDKLLTGASTEYTPIEAVDLSTSELMTTNYNKALDALDHFLSLLAEKPDYLLGNSMLIAKLKGLARRAGYLTQSEDAFGRKISGYDGIPFMDLGQFASVNGGTVTTSPIVKTDSAEGTTDLYAVKLGLDGFHGITLTGGERLVKTYLPDFNAPGAIKKCEVEMVGGVVLKNTLKAGVLRKIKIKPAA